MSISCWYLVLLLLITRKYVRNAKHVRVVDLGADVAMAVELCAVVTGAAHLPNSTDVAVVLVALCVAGVVKSLSVAF